MKKFLKIIGGIFAAFILAIVAVFYFTAGMTDTANAFFQAIKKQDIASAHGYLSEDFKASTDETALKEFLSKGAILKFKEASWSNRQISGGRGELEGEVITETGGVVPLKLMFVKENETWKIYGIQKPTAGLQTEQASPTIPSKEDQTILVKKSMHDFAISVNNKSMEYFRSTASQIMQKQFTTEMLGKTYSSVYGTDLTVLDNLEPTIEPAPSLEASGELVLKGYYPTRPRQIHFEQAFIYEGVAWKLTGFNFSAK